jgi:hypothetical protein
MLYLFPALLMSGILLPVLIKLLPSGRPGWSAGTMLIAGPAGLFHVVNRRFIFAG